MADTTVVLAKGDIEHPVHLVFNAPMTAFRVQDLSSVIGQAGDEIAGLLDDLTIQVPFTLNHDDGLQLPKMQNCLSCGKLRERNDEFLADIYARKWTLLAKFHESVFLSKNSYTGRKFPSKEYEMLTPNYDHEIPEMTVEVAKAAFP